MFQTWLPDFNDAEKKGEEYIFKTWLPAYNNAEKRAKNMCFRHGFQILTIPKKTKKGEK